MNDAELEQATRELNASLNEVVRYMNNRTDCFIVNVGAFEIRFEMAKQRGVKKSSKTVEIEPFSSMRVEIEDIDFNLDGLEGDELEEKVEELPTSGAITLYSRELFDLEILENGKNGKWILNLGNLRDYVEEHISSDTDTLLNDFNFSYTVSD